jgi:hypothetical protein
MARGSTGAHTKLIHSLDASLNPLSNEFNISAHIRNFFYARAYQRRIQISLWGGGGAEFLNCSKYSHL